MTDFEQRMTPMCIRIKADPLIYDHAVIKHHTMGAAGFDLRYAGSHPVKLQPGDQFNAPTGVAIALPTPEQVALLFGRSGMGSIGIGMANGVGVIDSDYRGEIYAMLINHGKLPYIIEPGARIAQLVILSIFANFSWQPVEQMPVDTTRGVQGFGSTGK